MIVKIDLKELNTKALLLKRLCEIIPDMFAPNYDALIDSATYNNEDFELQLVSFDYFEDKQNLSEILEIIANENKKFKYAIN